MLLSFAQFEREIAGERIRDKIAASKKKGMWMGGNVPLGYDVKDRKLIINEPEAATVRLTFRRYAELGSVALLRAELDRLGLVSKRREGAGGRLAGGQRFSRGALYLMLQNRIYRGDIVHQSEAYPGQHEAILDPELWQIVQDKLAANRQERALALGAEAPSLLAGLIVDSDGNRMTPTHATKKVKRYCYYVSAPLLAGEGCVKSTATARRKVTSAATTAKVPPKSDEPKVERVTKQERLLTLLSQAEGASIEEMMQATDWQQHSVRGFLAGTVKKKLGFSLTTSKAAGDVRRYRIETRRGR
jgi:hypothetical protein